MYSQETHKCYIYLNHKYQIKKMFIFSDKIYY